MESAFLFIMAAGQGTCLAVVSSAETSVGVMAYEMAMLVRRMGTPTAPPRFADHEPGGAACIALKTSGLTGTTTVVRPYAIRHPGGGIAWG